jgi:hypothetical protein
LQFFDFFYQHFLFSIASKYRSSKYICSEQVKWVKYETASIIERGGFGNFEAATV